jgi:uncharacterized membrane protein YedE/YeeE
MGHWPWWLGGPVLAAVVLGHVVVTGRALGLSAIYRRLVFWRSERAAERTRAEMARDPDALEKALLLATFEELGTEPAVLLAATFARPDEPTALPAVAGPPPLLSQVLFLGGIALGASLTRQFGAHTSAPATSPAITNAHGGLLFLVLAGGGLLVGTGASLSGGCTSGHGLSGCSRLRPASLLATVSFLASAMALTRLGALAGW